VVRHAFAQGINYFDTAETYQEGRAESVVGEALHDVRDQVVIATKTQASPHDKRDDLMQRLEGSLRRLRTDYVDVYFNHAVNKVERLQNPEWFEFARKAKQQGKLRFTGMSGHGGRLIPCLDFALDNDLVDVVLVAYNFGQKPGVHEFFTKSLDLIATQVGLPAVIDKAHAKGVGVVVMKTLMGAKRNDLAAFQWPGASFEQAAFAWVLSNPKLSGLVVSMTRRKHVDHFLAASGRTQVSRGELRRLQEYVASRGTRYCRPACDACEAACPAGVQVADVLRARMYAADYGDVPLGRSAYARIENGAAACAECADPRCLAACPYGVAIPELTRSTPGVLAGRS
jgi:predicted aldo/keto reductase-like oxidoreductase